MLKEMFNFNDPLVCFLFGVAISGILAVIAKIIYISIKGEE